MSAASSASTTSWASRFWTVWYSPLRAYWLLRGLYFLLGVDLWFEMVQHGGRYGLGQFNVAHFAWLDLVLPLPTPALYVGLLIASGTIALLLALGPAPRWLRLLLAASYTLAWLLSIHDSYQHHYLMSWLLCWCAAVPDLTARRALSPEPVEGWGLPMICVTCAIVYAFTGISKSESDWRGGAVLRSITHSAAPGSSHPGKFDRLRDLLLQLGFDDAGVWHMLALATIALQWTVALGYLAGAARDAPPSRARVWLSTIGLLAALSFHAVAELFHVFEIGLFSYYMMFVACVLLGPAQLWSGPTRLARWLSDQLDQRSTRAAPQPSIEPAPERGRSESWLATGITRGDLVRPVAAAALLLASGLTIPLPGALAATCGAALLVLLVAFGLARAPAARPATLDRAAFSTTLVALTLWLALTQSSIPFDYYRRTAGELYRMGQLEQSLSLYRQAQRYAPADESRLKKIHELERELGKSSLP